MVQLREETVIELDAYIQDGASRLLNDIKKIPSLREPPIERIEKLAVEIREKYKTTTKEGVDYG